MLIITFQATQTESVKDSKGKVVEGDPVSPTVYDNSGLSFYHTTIFNLPVYSIESQLCLGFVSRPGGTGSKSGLEITGAPREQSKTVAVAMWLLVYWNLSVLVRTFTFSALFQV